MLTHYPLTSRRSAAGGGSGCADCAKAGPPTFSCAPCAKKERAGEDAAYSWGGRLKQCECEGCAANIKFPSIGRCSCGNKMCCSAPAECACVCHTKKASAPASAGGGVACGSICCDSCEKAPARFTCAGEDCGVKSCSECLTGDVCGTCERQFCGDCGADFLSTDPTGKKTACWDCIWEGLILLEAKRDEKK